MDFRKNKNLSDRELLNQFYSSRDNSWLGVLLSRYTLLLFGVCMKYLKNEEEAKDAVQQIFLSVIGELEKYDVDYFKTWLYTVARNYCLMQIRKKQPVKSEFTDEIIASEETDSSIHYKKDLALQELELALQTLGHEQRVCVTLFYLHKKSYRQIADETGYSFLQIKSHIQNGKRNLRLKINKQLRDE